MGALEIYAETPTCSVTIKKKKINFEVCARISGGGKAKSEWK